MITRRGLLAGIVSAAAVTVVGAGPAEAATFPKWNRPTVYVLDKLGSAWSVGTAAEAWDDSSKLDVIRTTKLPSLAVSYVTVEYGTLPARVLGQTFVEKDGLGRYKRARVVINKTIRLNEFDPARRLALVRHEIGHAIGFNHSTTGTDVMGEEIRRGGPTGLSTFHKTKMSEVYGR